MIIYGHRHQGGYDIPDWAGTLKEYYWMIRVQGRDKNKRRRYYRYIAKEKLRLAQCNINQEIIKAVCRYLSDLHPANSRRIQLLLEVQSVQLEFKFDYR